MFAPNRRASRTPVPRLGGPGIHSEENQSIAVLEIVAIRVPKTRDQYPNPQRAPVIETRSPANELEIWMIPSDLKRIARLSRAECWAPRLTMRNEEDKAT